jgi:hypothetical protein
MRKLFFATMIAALFTSCGKDDAKTPNDGGNNGGNNIVDVKPTDDITGKFTDEIFRNYCLDNFDKNGDKKIQAGEVSEVTRLRVDSKNISSLNGIEYFTNLESLECYTNPLGTLDVSRNTVLKSLFCSGNKLASLDVSQNINLEILYCNANQLTGLDVSRNVNLKELVCHLNKLTSLDLSNNTNLQFLHCTDNQLTSLDLSKNDKLRNVDCQNNNLSAINVWFSKDTPLDGISISHDAGVELIYKE